MIRALLLAPALAAAALPASAQEDPGTYVINLRGVDIAVLAEQVSAITGRTLVLAPLVSGDVTVLSSAPLDPEGVWALFQSILRPSGFVAVETGVIWQVVPEAEARTIGGAHPGQEATDAQGSQDVATEVLRLSRLPSAEAVRVLRPLVAESGYLEALADPNAILVTDTRANVDRILVIAAAFDTESPEDAEVNRFSYADAAAVGRALVEVLGTSGTGARLSVDPSSNLLLVRGSQADIDEIRELARSLDVAPRRLPQEAITTSVFRLQFGDATVVAGIIQGTLGGGPALTNAVAADLGSSGAVAFGAEGGAGAEGEAGAEGHPAQDGFVPIERAPAAPAAAVSAQASVETNSVIVRGTAAQVQEVAGLIAALDVRRPQVMIEAAIVEVSGDTAERLGVQLGLGDAAPPGGTAGTSFPNGGVSLQAVLAAVGVPSVALSTGLTAGAGAADLITNTRVINTTVLADDGGTMVLGGLISDYRPSAEGRVPGLSRVPLVGGLFRSRNGSATQRTLFVFLRPTVLRDARDVEAAAQGRYARLRGAKAAAPAPSGGAGVRRLRPGAFSRARAWRRPPSGGRGARCRPGPPGPARIGPHRARPRTAAPPPLRPQGRNPASRPAPPALDAQAGQSAHRPSVLGRSGARRCPAPGTGFCSRCTRGCSQDAVGHVAGGRRS